MAAEAFFDYRTRYIHLLSRGKFNIIIQDENKLGETYARQI